MEPTPAPLPAYKPHPFPQPHHNATPLSLSLSLSSCVHGEASHSCSLRPRAARRGSPGQLLHGHRRHLGRRQGEGAGKRQPPPAGARPDLRLRLPVQARVPLRPCGHGHQARRRQLRRHRLRLLPVVAGADARRDRLRVPGEPHRGSGDTPHQRVQPGEGQQGAAVLPVVRPQAAVPHLLHRLESAADTVLRGRDAHQRVPEPGAGDGSALPQEPAHAALLQPVERRRLGHPGGAREDGLVQGPLRLLLPQLPRRRLRLGRRQVRLLAGEWHLVGPVPGRRRRPEAEVGQAELHGLRLLHRQAPLPPAPSRVRLLPLSLSSMKQQQQIEEEEEAIEGGWKWGFITNLATPSYLFVHLVLERSFNTHFFLSAY